jgi:hypothetical protein
LLTFGRLDAAFFRLLEQLPLVILNVPHFIAPVPNR